MDYVSHRLRSGALSNEREILVHIPVSGRCSTLLVFLDSEIHRERVGASQVVEDFVGRNRLEDPAVAFVSYCTPDARWIECECHSPFSVFIVDELLPWLKGSFPALGEARNQVLVGLSYTGLAASWVGLERPESFGTIVSQSGSYWWNDCWICRQLEAWRGGSLPAFYLGVGTGETDENVRHKEDLVQVVSQISGVRRFRDALEAAGARVKYEEFDGGHDGTCWRKMLPKALACAMPAGPERTEIPRPVENGHTR